MKKSIGSYDLNGRYVVYYDDAKTKIMARIGFTDSKPNGKLERYNMEGVKVYEATLLAGQLNGLLKVYKNVDKIIETSYASNKVISLLMNTEYTYSVSYNAEEIPSGDISIRQGEIGILVGTLTNGIYRTIDFYKYGGVIDSSLKLDAEGKYHEDSKYVIRHSNEVCMTFNHGVRGPEGNSVNKLYFNKDMILKYNGLLLEQAGKDYAKI